jgi:hypothetical protein
MQYLYEFFRDLVRFPEITPPLKQVGFGTSGLSV